MPPAARLGGAPGLQAIGASTPRLDLRPRHVLQQDRPTTWGRRLARGARGGGGAVLVHLTFAAAFLFLLSFRDVEMPREVETPVEVVVEPPKAASPKGEKGEPKAQNRDRLEQALAPPVAPDPAPPAPPQVRSPPGAARPDAKPDVPSVVAPPPEPTRAATQDRAPKPANLAPERDREDAAAHEAKPAEAPRALTTADGAASFALPMPAPPQLSPDAAAPPVPAKEPSAAEKLAAALPMDTSAMPMSFRSVLAGNGAQVSAVYKGLVYGRFNRHPEIGERARRQKLKGQVVVAFTIDDAGAIDQIAVVQSSGKAAVDALGLDLVRAASPFPPPPPGAQRSFTPALSFGE